MNKLAQSSSPYLQQHANNPVDWHEWGAEALTLAQETGKPILLSIGYSACHWCHVMAHESFEDERIAALMNEHFVNIKVDREERPDIDQIYQTAHSMLTQKNGGWPLTMFLTPDTTPFFGGTYFPQTARYGLPGFDDLLQRVAQYHRDQQDAIQTQNAQLLAALSTRTSGDNALETPVDNGASENDVPEMSYEPIDAGLQYIAQSYDAKRGGFGRAPKFPHPEMMDFCLRRYAASGNQDARQMACFTLAAMVRGGIFDQLGGGFARYSVDEHWAIPHFEKMLYDNGPLLRLLADARLVSEDDAEQRLFDTAMNATCDWVMREMQSPEGGYYSTIDADSEGHEGKFYVWTLDEMRAVLTENEMRYATLYFGLDRPANFEGKHWNPIQAESMARVAELLEESLAETEAVLASAREKLFAARATRIHPGRDEKILTSWNALMIEGMAHAARVTANAAWLASARRALDFIKHTMWDGPRKRLYATHKGELTHLNAYLDDYAFLIKAILEILQADFRAEDLAFACELADVLLDQFEDRSSGGFFFTSHDHEKLIARPKPSFDNATPSGNGVAAFALQRLAHLTNDMRYAKAAERTLQHFWEAIVEQPSGHASLLMALEEWLQPPSLTILTGAAKAVAAWRDTLAKTHRPTAIVVDLSQLSQETNAVKMLPEALDRPASVVPTAYVCVGLSCLPPIVEFNKLRTALKSPIIAA